MSVRELLVEAKQRIENELADVRGTYPDQREAKRAETAKELSIVIMKIDEAILCYSGVLQVRS